MTADHKRSESLDGWGGACRVLGIILAIIGLFAALMSAEWGVDLAVAGFALLVYAPLLKGFAVLVRNAESEEAERELRNMKQE